MLQLDAIAPLELRSAANAADLILPDYLNRAKINEMLAYMKNHAWIRYDEEGRLKHDTIRRIQHIAINDLGIKLLEKLEDNQKIWIKLHDEN